MALKSSADFVYRLPVVYSGVPSQRMLVVVCAAATVCLLLPNFINPAIVELYRRAYVAGHGRCVSTHVIVTA